MIFLISQRKNYGVIYIQLSDEERSSYQHQKAPNFSAFHWSPHASLVSICQHFITMRVVHLLKKTETSLITESNQVDLIMESNQAVRAMHSCNSWFEPFFCAHKAQLGKNCL